jgi:ribonucleoside-triphosphate reductase
MSEPLDYLSFKLPEDFIDQYKERTPDWGFSIGGGNSLGELTFFTKYSRKKEDGTKERWYETCRRVIEGMYSIQKDHIKSMRLPWNEAQGQRSAREAFERMFTFKWLPPGRGLEHMGSIIVNKYKDSSPLQNCSFISTEKISSRSVEEAVTPFTRLAEMSMLGIGVGFDTKGAGKLDIHEPTDQAWTFLVPDSREGWAESIGVLLESYFFSNRGTVLFDYSEIRPEGAPIKTFGGIAPGPGPLIELHNNIRTLFSDRGGSKITGADIVDIQNMIGQCVVSGGRRRTAEIALGEPDDKEFLNLKNYEVNSYRAAWGWASNNSVVGEVGMDYTNLVEPIAENGEPGILYLDLCRQYGRLIDPPNNKDYRVVGTNPCSEQSLESWELCTLVETFPFRHESLEDYKRTLKFAYLYGKTVTLLPTHWAETNAIMQRNRRIGCSISGVAQFAEARGWTELRSWLNEGYREISRWDEKYSEWLAVRESIKTTSVKPSGTVSLLAGATPGVHWPIDTEYTRRMRLTKTDPILKALKQAGYHIEPDVTNPDYTMVVELPTLGPDVRNQEEVTVWEKAHLAILAQRYWSDNQVSVTLTFRQDEKDQIESLLRAVEGQLKSVSFLPIVEGEPYPQMPYERITADDFFAATKKVKPMNWDYLYDGGEAADADGDKFCSNDVCELPVKA